LDQVHLPNPVMMEINRLQQENKELKERVDALSAAVEQK
jgi:cell division septum initiation protein DivIVA